MNEVVVLMSTYNGEKYIREQMDSLLSQENVDLQIVIRDDGSSDHTVDIIREYDSAQIRLTQGSNLGFAQSFWTLIKEAPEAEYYAFCDQDDIWHKNKLSAAIDLIKHSNSPELYTSDVVMVDSDKNVIKANGFGASGVLTYPDSLKRSILPGCTFVFNRALRNELIKYNGFMISHDWTTYIIANALGKVVFDQVPHMDYRIHSSNTIGYESRGSAICRKIKRFMHPKQIRTRSLVAKNIYSCFKDDMDEQKKKLTYCFAHCSESIKCAIQLMRYKEYRIPEFLFMLMCGRI